MIAIEHFDVDSRLGLEVCDLSELAWLSLIQSLDEHVPLFQNCDACRFERCTIFWSANTGAHEVHGAILVAYAAAGGAGLPNNDRSNGLGLPLSDETDFPAWAGFGRYNTFEHGSVVWNGAATCVCPAFKIKLGLVQTEESDGRRTVSLTEAGTSYVEEHRDELSKVWNVAAGDEVSAAVSNLRNQYGQLHAAVAQIMAAGTDEQRETAATALADARKAIYRLLAE